jgi:predicted nucleic acid-binding protein
MTDGNSLFIDTNVLIYANVAAAPLHDRALNALTKAHQSGRALWISRQVIREFVAVRTRPQTFARPSNPDVLIERVDYLLRQFHIADETAAVTAELLKLVAAFAIGGRQVHDANIVATMRTHGIAALLTHNIKDFERFGESVRLEGI